ncbi:MAG: helix-turn-helix domain-containing protein [Gemmobacter sp.]
MSTAIAVFHGDFGRVCLYGMDRSMVPHAHREGHLIFHVQGPRGEVVVEDRAYPLSPGQATAISPWQRHYYRHAEGAEPTLALVLYIRPGWFLNAARRPTSSLRFGRVGVEVTDLLARHVYGIAGAMLDPDADHPFLPERLCDLTQGCFDQSWQWTEAGAGFVGSALALRDFRVRRAMRFMQDSLTDTLSLDHVAREVGLSRPHFFKLFREQVGTTPNLYLNSLRMERAIDLLAQTQEAVADIGLDLGFSSQASFSRFFIANGVVPPSAYRRSVHLAQPVRAA